jgi:fructosamine-3-kinase
MKTEEYTNRYGDKFTFTETEDGSVLWLGNFEWCRTGCPNVYDDAYNEYKRDGGTLSMKEFIDEVHDIIRDENGDYVSPSRIGQSYRELVYSDWNTINMVDPSGGPYLAGGMTFFDKTIHRFEETKGGYKIIFNTNEK